MSDSAERCFTATQAGITMQARVTRQSQDVLIQLIGGDIPHYGVVTTVDRVGQVTTTALPSRPGHVHQEGVLTKRLAATLAGHLQGNAVIVAGMHVNAITPVQMCAASTLTQRLGAQVAAWLDAHPVAAPHATFAPRRPDAPQA